MLFIFIAVAFILPLLIVCFSTEPITAILPAINILIFLDLLSIIIILGRKRNFIIKLFGGF
jgi:hypothetical protein